MGDLFCPSYVVLKRKSGIEVEVKLKVYSLRLEAYLSESMLSSRFHYLGVPSINFESLVVEMYNYSLCLLSQAYAERLNLSSPCDLHPWSENVHCSVKILA